MLCTFSRAIISILKYGHEYLLTIRILTVTNKSLHLENRFVDVSTVLVHKVYYNISQAYLESLKIGTHSVHVGSLYKQ